MRITVAHEWLTNWAGSEQVMARLVGLVSPDRVVASVVDPEIARRHLPGVPVRELWPSRLPGAHGHWQRYAPAMLAAWAGARIEADALVVSSHFAAHAATFRFDGPSIVYYHTPARILWRPDIELERLPARFRTPAERLLLPPLRRWDRIVSAHPSVPVANSSAVAARIRDAYGREAEVVHPPVDVARFSDVARDPEPRHLLWLGRLVAYKRADVAVEAARRTGLKLVVIGDGPERAALERAAPANVEFRGHAPESEVRDALSKAHALVFPGEEDFGIAPVEALAAGVPVVALGAGGALDYVREGSNGLLVKTQDPDDWAEALRVAVDATWNERVIRESAAPFDAATFDAAMSRVLDRTLGPDRAAAGANR